MPHPPVTDPRSPFVTHSFLRVLGCEDESADLQAAPSHPRDSSGGQADSPMNEGGCADEPVADITPANTSIAPVTVSVPKPVPVDRHPPLIRMLTELIARIRWFPVAWQLLCAIPSETRQAWAKAFGSKGE